MSRRVIDIDAPVNELLGKLEPKTELEQTTAGFVMKKTEQNVEAHTPAPKGYKLDPKYIETKTARLQLVLKPSVLASLKKYCKANKVSVNDYVGTLLEERLKEK